MNKLIMKFSIKEDVSDDNFAIIEGIANQSNVVDRGGDLTNKDTFKKTVISRPKVPLLAGHDRSKVMGINELSLTADGSLRTLMEINLDTQEGKEHYSLLKQFQKAGLDFGLSIGYRTIKEKLQADGVNVLEEVEVREVSLTPFPMNDKSTVTAVKDDAVLYLVRQKMIKKLLLTA